jgi:hypothetical protein
MTKAKYLGPNIPITVHSVDRAASRISIAYRDTDISRNSVVDTIFSFVSDSKPMFFGFYEHNFAAAL